jgi:hypothetical protein
MNIEDFDYTVNLLQALLWQYNTAPNIRALLEGKQEWYSVNQSAFWQGFYDNIFNLRTANQFGLSVWARILDVPLFINPTPPMMGDVVWGFNAFTTPPTLSSDTVAFDQGPFSPRDTSIFLPLEQQRFLLRLRYYQLTSSGRIPEINTFLNYLYRTSNFGTIDFRTAWVTDGLDMTMTYVFNYAIDALLLAILEGTEGNLDILPRPAGVRLKFLVLTDLVWGFDANQNFDNGEFITQTAL